MSHLTTSQFVDVVDGTVPDASFPHLVACAACRAQISDLRATMTKVAEVEVPEPSPLFWDRFSSRVADAVTEQTEVVAWRDATRSWAAGWRFVVRFSLGAVALALVAGLIWVERPTTVAVPVPSLADSAIPTEAVEGTAMLPPDDPALDMVADLGTGLDWEQIHDAGIVTHAGMVNRAVSQLSPNERAELGRLLKQELEGGGD